MSGVSNIHAFIQDNYTVVYKGEGVDENDLSSANEYLLADHHGSAGHSALNSLFINTFSKEGDVVMVEAIPSMVEARLEDALQTVWLNTKAKTIGWDIGKIGETTGSTLLQESGDLEIQKQILIKQLLDPELAEKGKEVFEKLMITSRKILDVVATLEKMGMFDETKFLEMISKTLPARITSMTNTMEKAREIYNKSFLIAGQNHLKHNFEDHRFSLEEFYKFLKDRKVVILFPKDAVVSEMGKERQKTTELIQMAAILGGFWKD
jgi:hypothetical protein